MFIFLVLVDAKVGNNQTIDLAKSTFGLVKNENCFD